MKNEHIQQDNKISLSVNCINSFRISIHSPRVGRDLLFDVIADLFHIDFNTTI